MDQSKLRIGVLGVKGRVGGLLVEAIQGSVEFVFSKAFDIKEQGSKEEVFTESDVVIDFSLGTAVKENCALAVKEKVPLVVGTTGYSLEELKVSYKSSSCPILLAPNVLVSVALFAKKCADFALSLGKNWDIHISDHHHRFKKDTPSGTSLMIAKVLQENCAWLVDKVQFSSIRGGSFSITNTVTFSGDHEIITLSHQAFSLKPFVNSALEGAMWLCQKPPGVYDVMDWVKERL